ncbi:MAG: prenyltransferase/squalene oxidase repeat-containing protein [Pirellulaceae bacterium]
MEALTTLDIEPERLVAAYAKAREELFAQQNADGHWTGELATSALSTATAVSALAIAARVQHQTPGSDPLVTGGVRWLMAHQRADGGWGDTDLSYSNIATTMLGVAALHLAEAAPSCPETLARAEAYIEQVGRVTALRQRYGRDKTFAVPILTNCALAGLVEWSEVAPLPFELACLPQSLYRFLQLPVVSYAIPALVAMGQVRFHHRPPWNPLWRWVRWRSQAPSLAVLEKMQPASGGFLEAVPLTSFVVMSLGAMNQVECPVATRGLEFIRRSVRPDGSWPIDTNLATWNTTLALNALAAGGEDLSGHTCLDWLLACQQQKVHPYTGAAAGGWGWSDLSGAVPDADDTPGALLALANWSRSPKCLGRNRRKMRDAALRGIRWLLTLQNRDGGWPTFCRGWGKLPFDRSGADLTAHAIRALHAWQDLADSSRSIQRGLVYLERNQQADGSWRPLWFGNQDHPGEENPIYGTAKVLLAYRDLGLLRHASARRGFDWLVGVQSPDGGWGGGPSMRAVWRERWKDAAGPDLGSSVEETALAVEALLGHNDLDGPRIGVAVRRGLHWLTEAVESGMWTQPSPIGFYFAKLWYHEQLYPIIFTVAALGQALRRRPALDPSQTPNLKRVAGSGEIQPRGPILPA